MTLELVCRNCQKVLSAETEDELVDLGQRHAVENGHNPPPAREHVLARIRRRNGPESQAAP